MRTLAITGIVTVAMISRITLIDAIRATPPSLRMSEGTRSSAITAQAPAFSAILACSAFVTSMITPPLSISAQPTFARHSFVPFGRLPLSFAFFASMSLLLSLLKCFVRQIISGVATNLSSLRRDYHKPRFAPRQNVARFIANFANHENVSPLLLRLAAFHNNFMLHVDRLQILHRHLRRHRANLPKPADLPHRFIQQHPDDSSMPKACAALVPLTQNKSPHYPTVHVVLFKRQLHPAGIVSAAPKTFVRRIRRQGNRRAQSFSLPRSLFLYFVYLIYVLYFIFFRPPLRGCAPPCGLRAAVSAFQFSAIPPTWPPRAQSVFHPGG